MRTNVIGFDDAPFAREHRGDVSLVGVVCSRTRIDVRMLGRSIRFAAFSFLRVVSSRAA
jgi:hypothetical protein